MIYKKGNALEASEYVLVHGCNSLGHMGAGIAKAIKEKWPKAYEVYRKFLDTYGVLPLGTFTIYRQINPPKLIVNLITQENVGTQKRMVNYTALVSGLEMFLGEYAEEILNKYERISDIPEELRKISLPRIGAGLGGGDWDIISVLLSDLEEMYDGVFEFVIYDL